MSMVENKERKRVREAARYIANKAAVAEYIAANLPPVLCQHCNNPRIPRAACKTCAIIRVKAWVAANPERNKEMHAAKYQKNKEQVRIDGIAYRAANADRLKATAAVYRAANSEKLKEGAKRSRAARHLADPGKRKATGAAYRAKNKDLLAARSKAIRSANPEKVRLANNKYAEKHPGVVNAKTARRRAKKRNATPIWADKELTKDFYRLAAIYTRSLERTFHVDHVVPLQSKFVCGLHTPENFQVLEFMDNVVKSNLFWPDMP